MSKQKQSWWENLSKPLKCIVVIVAAITLIGVLVALDDTSRVTDLFDKNTAPEIEYAYTGQLPHWDSTNHTNRSLQLRAGILDKNGDNLTITYWIKNNITSWKGICAFEGNNGTYAYNLSMDSLMPERLNSYKWRIDVTDGKAITSRIYPLYLI
jgi:hypothetical protein